MRRVTYFAVASAAAALVGCPDWSRPDPRLQAARPAPRASGDPVAGAPAAQAAEPRPAERQPSSGTSSAGGVAALREGLRALEPGAPDALERLERLESLGFDLLDRGAPDEQRDIEALLEELSDLRAELVERRRGS